MSTRDDEIEDEIIREEPEEIERHTKPHDSYRELPSNDDVVDMVQPPLEPQIEELEEELAQTMEAVGLKQDEPVTDEREKNESEPTTDEVTLTDESLTQQPKELLTQDAMLADTQPVITAEEGAPSVLVQEKNTELVPEAPHEEVQGVQESHVQSMSTESQPSSHQPVEDKSQSQQQAPTVYHTVSGGPETIHDLAAAHRIPVQSTPQNTTEYPSSAAASGYTIPNPNYTANTPTDIQVQSNFGSIFFLVILAILGGVLTYVYFYMPQTFDQLFDAVVVIKNQLLKQ